MSTLAPSEFFVSFDLSDITHLIDSRSPTLKIYFYYSRPKDMTTISGTIVFRAPSLIASFKLAEGRIVEFVTSSDHFKFGQFQPEFDATLYLPDSALDKASVFEAEVEDDYLEINDPEGFIIAADLPLHVENQKVQAQGYWTFNDENESNV